MLTENTNFKTFEQLYQSLYKLILHKYETIDKEGLSRSDTVERFLTIGFKAPAQTGKTNWVLSKLFSSSVVIVVDTLETKENLNAYILRHPHVFPGPPEKILTMAEFGSACRANWEGKINFPRLLIFDGCARVMHTEYNDFAEFLDTSKVPLPVIVLVD